jgi:DNA-binding beta-propeller fold protein YncE
MKATDLLVVATCSVEDIVTKSELRRLVMIGAVITSTLAGVVACAVGAGPGRGAGSASEPQVGTTLKRAAVIDLPGPPGRRFDYLTIDDDDHYLFSAHLGAGLLYVIDLRTNRVVKTITGVPGIEGVAYISEGKKVYTSNWYENKIGIVDLTRMAVIKKLPTADKPDGIAYAGPFHKAYVSDERGKAEAVVDVREDRIVKTLKFDSETGVPRYDPVARKVYVNLQEQNALAVIDPASDTVIGQYPVSGCVGNHGMALDPERQLAFLSCEGNDVLTVFDLDTRRLVAHLPMAKGADVVEYDPGLRRVYVACSSGFISVFQVDDPQHVRKIEDFPVERKVHSLAVDVTTHRVYAPEEEEQGRPVARMVVFDALIGPSSERQ